MQDNPPVFSAGKVAPAPINVATELPTMVPNNSKIVSNSNHLHWSQFQPFPTQPERLVVSPPRPKTQVISVNPTNLPPNYKSPIKNGYPPVLWVIGGPGSNKANLCSSAAKETGWTHISLGKLLRAAAEPPDPRNIGEVNILRECISNGEMVPLDIVMKYVESHMGDNMEADGIILDGFPRDMTQATEFETKVVTVNTYVVIKNSKRKL